MKLSKIESSVQGWLLGLRFFLTSEKTKDYYMIGKTEHFKALTQDCHASALADHVISTGHNIKWDHFEIIATGKSDLQC